MNTATGSKPFRLDATDLQKIGNSAMLAIAGIAVGSLVLLNQRVSEQQPDSLLAVLVATLTPAAINVVRKWASDNRKNVLPPVDLNAPPEPVPNPLELLEGLQIDPALLEFIAKTAQKNSQQENARRAAETARSDLPPIP